MLRKSAYVSILLALIIFVGIQSVHSAKPAGNGVLVTMIEGTARVVKPGAKSGIRLKTGDRLTTDCEVRVDQRSRVEMKFPDNTVMRLSENSCLKLNQVAFNDKTGAKTFKVNLTIGKLWANVKKLVTSDSAVEVHTVNAVAGVRGTVYRVNVEEDTSALVKVYEGAVFVANPPHEISKPASPVGGPVPVSGPHEVAPPHHEVTLQEWQVIIQSMQQIAISSQGIASQPQNFTPADDADDWVTWNQEQDKKVQF